MARNYYEDETNQRIWEVHPALTTEPDITDSVEDEITELIYTHWRKIDNKNPPSTKMIEFFKGLIEDVLKLKNENKTPEVSPELFYRIYDLIKDYKAPPSYTFECLAYAFHIDDTTQQEIGDRYGVSAKAVSKHVSNMRMKLGINEGYGRNWSSEKKKKQTERMRQYHNNKKVK